MAELEKTLFNSHADATKWNNDTNKTANKLNAKEDDFETLSSKKKEVDDTITK